MEPIIKVENLARNYRQGEIEVQALRGVTLVVEQGEFVAIMGSSGSGKSTLMSILGCLDRPSSGRYFFQGTDVAELSEPQLAQLRSEKLGFVFQSFNLLPRTSAVENVALPLFYSPSEPNTVPDRFSKARDVLALVQMTGHEASTPGQLSGGQQQRVAIARALINDPTVLLADEPTGNLDTRTSHEIMDTLRALNRDRGVTIIVVTHEADIAAYADRIVTMRDGEIVSDVRKQGEAKRRITPVQRQYRKSLPAVSAAGIRAFASMISGAAMQALLRNRMRSALTMLGVFIGVAALISMVAVGQGANEAVRKQIESLGTNLLVVVPGAVTVGGFTGGSGSASTLTLADVDALRREAPAVANVTFLMRQMGQAQYGNQNWTTSIQGVSADYPPITNWEISEGRGISDEDESAAALVAVLGQTVTRQLFGANESPVGARIEVKGVPLRVIGSLVPKGQTQIGTDQDDVVMIPFTTAERKVLGIASPSQQQIQINWPYPPPPNPYNLQQRLTGYVNQIYVQALSPSEVQPAIAQVTEILARRHRIAPGEPNDFTIRNLSRIAETAKAAVASWPFCWRRWPPSHWSWAA